MYIMEYIIEIYNRYRIDNYNKQNFRNFVITQLKDCCIILKETYNLTYFFFKFRMVFDLKIKEIKLLLQIILLNKI